MTNVGKWVESESKAKGATREVLRCLAARAEGCIAVVSVWQLVRETRLSRSTVFVALARAQKMGEIERIQWVSLAGVVPFHFTEGRRKIGRRFFASGSDHARISCPQLAGFVTRYGGSPNFGYIRGTQLNLLEVPAVSWAPVITDEELRWRSEQLKRRLGIVERTREFRLES